MHVVANLCIVFVLVGLSVAVFTVDLSHVFLTVSAPVYNGNRDRSYVSLVINVHDGGEYIEPIMKILEERGVQATFFINGVWTKSNMALVEKMGKAFELGNHGFAHENISSLREADQRARIRNTHDLVKGITGTGMNLFSPPLGGFSRNTLRAAQSLGYTTIMWSKDASSKNSDSIFANATRDVRGGDLILLQPSGHTVDALPKVLDYYISNGLSVVKVSQNIG